MVKVEYINYLLHAYESVNDKQKKYIENLFYEIAETCNDVFHPFPLACNIKGVSGSVGTIYDDSQVRHLMKTIKTFLSAVIWHMKRR